MLRVEVRVQRRRLHPDPAGEVAQRQRRQSLGAGPAPRPPRGSRPWWPHAVRRAYHVIGLSNIVRSFAPRSETVNRGGETRDCRRDGHDGGRRGCAPRRDLPDARRQVGSRTRATRRSASTRRRSAARWASWSSAATKTASGCCATRGSARARWVRSGSSTASPKKQWSERFPDHGGRTTSMLGLDPPDHTRLRRLVAKAFTPKTVENLRPDIVRLTDELLDGFDGVVDVMPELALQLPMNGDRRDARHSADRSAPSCSRTCARRRRCSSSTRRSTDWTRRPRRAEIIAEHLEDADRRTARRPDRRSALRAHPRRGAGRPAQSRRADHHHHVALRRRLRDDHESHRQRPARVARASRRAAAPARRSDHS